MVDYPIWIPNEMTDYVRDKIVHPIQHPEAYHTLLAPIPRMQVIFGRFGNDTIRCLNELFKQHHEGVTHKVVTVEIGRCRVALDAIKAAAPTTNVIIVDRADVMCYEPDNQDTMLENVELTAIADRTGCIFVFVFNRTRNDGAMDRMNGWPKECALNFINQFQASGLMTCPHADYRISLFKWCFAELVRHVSKTRAFTCLLDDRDYVVLSNYSNFATVQDIIGWMRKIALPVIMSAQLVTLEMYYLEQFFIVHQGTTPHILDYDGAVVEERFYQTAGIVRLLPRALPPVTKKEDAEGSVQKELGSVTVPGFTNARASLKRQKIEEIELFPE